MDIDILKSEGLAKWATDSTPIRENWAFRDGIYYAHKAMSAEIARLNSQYATAMLKLGKAEEALEDIAKPANAGCGCDFPCRCDCDAAEAINAQHMREVANETLAAITTNPGTGM